LERLQGDTATENALLKRALEEADLREASLEAEVVSLKNRKRGGGGQTREDHGRHHGLNQSEFHPCRSAGWGVKWWASTF